MFKNFKKSASSTDTEFGKHLIISKDSYFSFFSLLKVLKTFPQTSKILFSLEVIASNFFFQVKETFLQSFKFQNSNKALKLSTSLYVCVYLLFWSCYLYWNGIFLAPQKYLSEPSTVSNHLIIVTPSAPSSRSLTTRVSGNFQTIASVQKEKIGFFEAERKWKETKQTELMQKVKSAWTD